MSRKRALPFDLESHASPYRQAFAVVMESGAIIRAIVFAPGPDSGKRAAHDLALETAPEAGGIWASCPVPVWPATLAHESGAEVVAGPLTLAEARQGGPMERRIHV